MMTFQRHDLAAVQSFTRDQASRSGLPERRLVDLVPAVNELATNAVVHTPGPGTVRIWREDQRLVCEVTDPGTTSGTGDGRQRTSLRQVEGHGLWMVTRACDLVELRTGLAGTSVRVCYNLV